ncbi:uncharacterized protein [Miscanthus floridulus]|uniref:uncharacterized protein n=1 Tax=Miscanthus floridulus TaxID=154761 RepID=UPI003457CB4E
MSYFKLPNNDSPNKDEVQQPWPLSVEGSSDLSSPDQSPPWSSEEESFEDAYGASKDDDYDGASDAEEEDEEEEQEDDVDDDDNEPPAKRRRKDDPRSDSEDFLRFSLDLLILLV